MKYKIKYIITAILVTGLSVAVDAQDFFPVDTTDKATQEVNVLYGTQEYGRFVGNMSVVKGDALRTYPSLTVNEALAGRLPGVFIRQNSGLPGTDNYTINVRGSMGDYLVLVDGTERALTQYDIEQIEEVRVLKDPISKALYGGRMCNGIIMVTTRRGKEMKKSEFRVNVQHGVKKPTRIPGYLNSYDFAIRYNEALDNDNISMGKYSEEALNGYKNGINPYQYPDVDFHKEFLNNSMHITRANAEYYGGSEKTKYYVHGAFQTEGGLEKYGNKKNNINTFNMQANLDTRFTDEILLHANLGGYIADRTSPGNFSIGTLSSRYPNSYPIFVAPDSIGGTDTWKDNPYGGQALSGYLKENHIRVQADLGLEFKLDKLVKGLSVKPAYSLDVFHRQNIAKTHRFPVYSIGSFDDQGNPLTFNTLQTEQLSTDQWLNGEDYLNRWAFTGTASYIREFNKHAVHADLVYYISKAGTAGNLYDYKRQNLGLRANYTFSGKYTFEGVLNYVGSQSYDPDNRFKFYPAVGAGWLISGEEFMKHISAVDFLKINASWGIMGDGDIATNFWRRTWAAGGTYYFNTSTSAPTNYLYLMQNVQLDWPKQSEVDISIEANVLKSIFAKVSYFQYEQSGLLSRKVNSIPSVIGGNTYLPFVNFEKKAMRGTEVELSYTQRINDVAFSIGGHLTYSKTEKKVADELDDPNFSTIGTPMDGIWGYRFDGYYTQNEIDAIQNGTSNLPVSSYMDPSSLKAGNLKYKDINGDKVIDKYDRELIGNSEPRLMYGFDLNVEYKGFSLYAMFLGYGKHDRLVNNSYYQIHSTRKYSNVLMNGLPNGNPHPLLTTGTGTNDFQTSDYWIVNSGYIKLQNLAFSYSLPKHVVNSFFMQDLKFTFYATDLFTVSKIKELDPESLEAGISLYPLFKTFAFGVSMTF